MKTTKQYTFTEPTVVTWIHTNGTLERVRYGAYEAVMYTHENGWPVHRTVPLVVPSEPVHEITLENGIIIRFDKPTFLIYEEGYGPNK